MALSPHNFAEFEDQTQNIVRKHSFAEDESVIIEEERQVFHRTNRIKFIVFIITSLCLIGLLLILHESLMDFLRNFLDWARHAGYWGMFCYSLLFAIGCVTFFPVFLLTFGAGFIYAKIYGLYTGILIGTTVIFIGSIIGAIFCLYIGRYCIADYIRNKLSQYPHFARFEYVVASHGAKLMFLIRLSPFIPFNLFNYATGLTNVKFKDYLVGLFGIIPGNTLYVYIGTAFESVEEVLRGEYEGGKYHYGMFLGGLVITMCVVCWLTWIANKIVIQDLDKYELEKAASNDASNAESVK